MATPETDFDRLKRVVEKNPTDFSTWTQLISLAEKETAKPGGIVALKQVYDSFLTYFPLCYGYWKKYADAINNAFGKEDAVEIFERGCAAVAHSVDMWVNYINFLIAADEDLETIRSVCERAAEIVGNDYNSHAFWDKYIEFENNHLQTRRVAALYARILAIPLAQLDRYYQDFKVFASTPEHKPADDLVKNEEEYKELINPLEEKAEASMKAAKKKFDEAREARRAKREQARAEAEAAKKARALEKQQDVEEGEVSEEEEDAAASVADDADPVSEPEAEFDEFAFTVSEGEKYKAVLRYREEVYMKCVSEARTRYQHEQGLTRPYFHIKPVDDTQLQTWRDYLTHMEKANPRAACKLYERCVIPCALYHEFWLRYANFVAMKLKDTEKVREIYERAAYRFTRRPLMFIHYALFEENAGNVDAARKILSDLVAMHPTHLESVLKTANFERRHGDIEAAKAVYLKGLERPELQKTLLPAHYARFCVKFLSDVEAGRAALKQALETHPAEYALWVSVIDWEVAYGGETATIEARVQALFDEAERSATLSLTDKIELSKRNLDILDDFGTAIANYTVVEQRLKASQKQADATGQPQSRKRVASESSSAPASKRQATAKTETAAATPTAQYTPQQWQAFAQANPQYYQQWPQYFQYGAVATQPQQ